MEANEGKPFQMQILFNILPRISLHCKLQSVAKVLGHSPFEVGFLTDFEQLPPSPSPEQCCQQWTHISLSISTLIGGRGDLHFEAFSGILTVMLSFWRVKGFEVHSDISVLTTFATDCSSSPILRIRICSIDEKKNKTKKHTSILHRTPRMKKC